MKQILKIYCKPSKYYLSPVVEVLATLKDKKDGKK